VPAGEGRRPERGPEVALVRLEARHAEILGRFFEELAADDEATALFHPHPFTAEQAEAIAAGDGRDYYAAMLVGDTMVAYGMLRGWDEGYERPSLGIVIGAAHRGLGLGHLMMEYLHAVARVRGAPSIILRVYKHNTAAVELYRRMGYVLSELNEHEWRGTLDLRAGT